MEAITTNTKRKKIEKIELLWDFHPKSPIIEAYRTLITNIQFSFPDSPLKPSLLHPLAKMREKQHHFTQRSECLLR
jgi:hypothetical protein